jgi:DNA-binding response OmpR family regulator
MKGCGQELASPCEDAKRLNVSALFPNIYNTMALDAHGARVTMTTPLLLLVDDDVQLTRRLASYMQNHGFRTRVANSIDEAREAMHELQPDLVVLDWNLPGRDGLSQLIKWRATGRQTPVLMLSGNVSANHRIAGLRGGADDYLTKPFDINELVARIEALLRRTVPALQAQAPTVAFGPFRFDIGSASLMRHDEQVSLAAGELELMMILSRNVNKVLTREYLLELTGDMTGDRLDRSIDLRIARLRSRLGDEARSPQWIITVRGQGYRLDGQILQP